MNWSTNWFQYEPYWYVWKREFIPTRIVTRGIVGEKAIG